MGVVAVRRARVGSVRGVYRTRGRPLGRAALGRTSGPARASLAPAAAQWPLDEPRSFWDRLEDDRKLIRLKFLLLTSLLLLAALLEWVA